MQRKRRGELLGSGDGVVFESQRNICDRLVGFDEVLTGE